MGSKLSVLIVLAVFFGAQLVFPRQIIAAMRWYYERRKLTWLSENLAYPTVGMLRFLGAAGVVFNIAAIVALIIATQPD